MTVVVHLLAAFVAGTSALIGVPALSDAYAPRERAGWVAWIVLCTIVAVLAVVGLFAGW